MRLTNEFLQVEVSAKGAELKSLKSNTDGYEYLWSGDPQYWAKTSPVLFPIVGALRDDTYFYQGKAYHLPRHGFARDYIFEENHLSGTEAVFTLRDMPETHGVYPFAFRLSMHYKLTGHTLDCTYEVYNPSAHQPLFFSIGGHPAFAVHTNGEALRYDDSYLEFLEDEALDCHQLEGNLIDERIRSIPLEDHKLPLTHQLFYGDALVLKTLKSQQITLRNRANDRGVHFWHENFPYFGIWAAKDADFVCLEPWYGIADTVGHDQQLEGKEGIQQLEPGKTWTRGWEVTCF